MLYPTRRVDVNFFIETESGEEVERITKTRASAHRKAEQVAAAANEKEASVIRTESDDQIHRAHVVSISDIEDVGRWALYQQDANAGVKCAVCEEEIGFEEGCSSPMGSTHKGCASQHESKHPSIW